MSRKIKFRVWSKNLEKYIGGMLFSQAGYLYSMAPGFEFQEEDNKAYIVEQFTGLKDRNGKEIYEGDIVKWLDGLNEYIEFKVEWQDNRGRFCLRNEYSVFDYEDLSDKKKPYIEVIGNIHENPELLEEE